MKRIMTVAFAMILTVGLLCGCSGGSTVREMRAMAETLRTGGEAQDAATAVICTVRSNSAAPSETFFKAAVMDIAAHSLYNAVITAEGEPRVTSRIELDKREDFASSTTVQEIIAEQAEMLAEAFQDIEAVTDEADLFEAVTLAAREVKSHDDIEDVEHFRIYISDSMISTAGVLRMTSAALDGLTSPDEIARNLDEQGLLPEALSGCEVIVYGCGDTVAPQMKLYENNRRALENIWRAIFERAGASVTFEGTAATEAASGSYPAVSPVIVTAPMDVFDPNGVNDFSEMCRFQPGRAELLTDEAEVVRALEPYISYMESHPDYRLLIAGTTASADTPEVLRQLSYDRCETLRRLLVTNGADPDRIEVAGLGYEPTTFCIRDTDDAGNFVEELGRKNRRCLLMNADTTTAANVRKLAL